MKYSNDNLLFPDIIHIVGHFVVGAFGFIVLGVGHECRLFACSAIAENSEFLGIVSFIGSCYCVAVFGERQLRVYCLLTRHSKTTDGLIADACHVHITHSAHTNIKHIDLLSALH